MDRFIVIVNQRNINFVINLKSNMDRFIGFKRQWGKLYSKYLKSNMDRFIANFSLPYPVVLL